MTAAEMTKGEERVIIGFSDEELSVKLIEMGCLPGTPIVVNYFAPMGDPICFDIDGYDLSLRIAEAKAILVE